LNRSEHFDEKQHGGYETSFYIRLKAPLFTVGAYCPNVLAAYLTARRHCKRGWGEAGTRMPEVLPIAKCPIRTADIL
jgi:hypothetical protein